MEASGDLNAGCVNRPRTIRWFHVGDHVTGTMSGCWTTVNAILSLATQSSSWSTYIDPPLSTRRAPSHCGRDGCVNENQVLTGCRVK